MATTTKLYVSDNDTIKWEHGGKRYCLHLQQDTMPEDPREESELTTMACWHSRYCLGDEIQDQNVEMFWQKLVKENVPKEEILTVAINGEMSCVRLVESEKNPACYDIYMTVKWRAVNGKTVQEETLVREAVDKDYVADYLIDELSVIQCQTLLYPYAEWSPLWLYDHSGISISCGDRTYPYNDRWDSGQVGWIIAMKKTIMTETAEYVLDANGQRIRVEHKHPNGISTYSYETIPMTEEHWRTKAREIINSDVEIYDNYITDCVYGFTLYEAESPEDGYEPDWNEVESAWNFYGADIRENGMAEIGYGLSEALEFGAYECGTATKHTHTYYTF